MPSALALFLKITAIKRFINSENIIELDVFDPTLVVETIDSPIISELIRNHFKERTPVLSLHYDGKSITVEWTPIQPRRTITTWLLGDDAVRVGYQVFPSLPYPPIIASIFGLILAKRRPDEHVIVKIDNVDRELFQAKI